MFPAHRRTGINVGRRNGEGALDELRAHGIRIVSESLYGSGHRQVIFDIATGHVWSRQVTPATEPVAMPALPTVNVPGLAAATFQRRQGAE
jgi:chemotaxis protein CheD